MRPACQLDHADVPAEERFDICQVLTDRDLVALPLIVLVPLVVVVEAHRDDVVEGVDEPVRRGRADEPVNSAVQVGKAMIARLDLVE